MRRSRAGIVVGMLAATAVALGAASPAGAAGVEAADLRVRAAGPLATTSIVGGHRASPGEFPSAVAVLDHMRRGSSDMDDFMCGGSLIAPTVVLTAGHCVTEKDGSVTDATRKRVVLGRTDLRTAGGEEIAVSAIERHPLYEDYRLYYDVALLELAAPSTAAPVEIGDARMRLRESQRGTAVGWGLTAEDGDSSPLLLEVRLPLWSNRRCAKAYRGDHEPGLMLCASSRRAGKDVCNGDSGGPLMVADGAVQKLVGVVSFSFGCAVPGVPTTFAWAASPYMRDWIVRKAAALRRDDPDATAPELSDLRVAAGVVRYTSSEPASVVFKLRRRTAGRFVTLPTALVHAARAGANGFRMPGTLRGRRLKAGAYRIQAIATDQAGNLSAPVRVSVSLP